MPMQLEQIGMPCSCQYVTEDLHVSLTLFSRCPRLRIIFNAVYEVEMFQFEGLELSKCFRILRSRRS